MTCLKGQADLKANTEALSHDCYGHGKIDLLVSCLHLAADDAVAQTVVVLIVLIATHDEHLKEGKLLSKAVVKVLKCLSDGS